MSPEPLPVAIWGFSNPDRRIEPAGVHWEVRKIRDLITLNRCTLPVYRNPNVIKVEEPSVKSGKNKKRAKTESPPVETRQELFDADDEKYERYLMRLDPNDTKNQDHYKVLGIRKLRYMATVDEIRVAYRQKVLKHHPDKRKHKGNPLPAGEDYFTCITKAYEQLGMGEQKRRAYDSIDPKFNEEIPNEKDVTMENFFATLGPVFERNARWSTYQPVPDLGGEDATREEVERFYDFWFNWNSWREFSYLDEQDKEKGEDRWERREMEKQNKVDRERRRKDEAKRISTLVNMAHNKDPRVARFRREDQEAKDRVKEERARLKREKAEAEERERLAQEAEEKARREEIERQEQLAKEEARRQREAAKNAAKAQKKRLDNLFEENCYFTEDHRVKLDEMDRIERINLLLSTDELSALCDQIEAIRLNGDAVRTLLAETEMSKTRKNEVNSKANKENQQQNNKEVVLWTNEEIFLLTKAANLYPAGTTDRWIVIADYVNEHRKDKSTPQKTEKQVIKQTKLVQTGVAKPTAAAQNKLGAELPDEQSWTATEQAALEEALRKYPASDPERWNKIAADVPGRTKKDCIRRFKFLAEQVKNAKKA